MTMIAMHQEHDNSEVGVFQIGRIRAAKDARTHMTGPRHWRRKHLYPTKKSD